MTITGMTMNIRMNMPAIMLMHTGMSMNTITNTNMNTNMITNMITNMGMRMAMIIRTITLPRQTSVR